MTVTLARAFWRRLPCAGGRRSGQDRLWRSRTCYAARGRGAAAEYTRQRPAAAVLAQTEKLGEQSQANGKKERGSVFAPLCSRFL